VGAQAAERGCHLAGAREAEARALPKAGERDEAEARVRSWLDSEARALGRGRSQRQRARSLPESEQRARERRIRGCVRTHDQR
jgi:hypothetical protein